MNIEFFENIKHIPKATIGSKIFLGTLLLATIVLLALSSKQLVKDYKEKGKLFDENGKSQNKKATITFVLSLVSMFSLISMSNSVGKITHNQMEAEKYLVETVSAYEKEIERMEDYIEEVIFKGEPIELEMNDALEREGFIVKDEEGEIISISEDVLVLPKYYLVNRLNNDKTYQVIIQPNPDEEGEYINVIEEIDEEETKPTMTIDDIDGE